jgi:hypothetical protein
MQSLTDWHLDGTGAHHSLRQSHWISPKDGLNQLHSEKLLGSRFIACGVIVRTMRGARAVRNRIQPSL